MTRETKVGLVVAGSFVCLVGVVLVLKLQQAENPPDAAAQAQANPPAAGTPKGKGDPPPAANGPTVPAAPKPVEMAVVSNPQLQPAPAGGEVLLIGGNGGQTPPNGAANPPGGIQVPPNTNTLPPPVLGLPPQTTGAPVPLPPGPAGIVPPAPAVVEQQPPQTNPIVPPPMRVEIPAQAANPGVTNPPVVPETANATEQMLKEQALKAATASPPSVPTPPPVVAPTVPTAVPPAAVPVPGQAPPVVMPESKQGGAPVIPPNPTGPAPAVAPPVGVPAPVGTENPPVPPPVGVPAPVTPTNPINPPAPGTNPMPPEIKGLNVTPTDPPALPPVAVSPPAPITPPANTVMKENPAPVAVAVSPPRPVETSPVRVTETKIHTVTADQKTFADLSRRFYGIPDYAEALLKFNRDYPMATDAVRQNPPVLQPGMRVFIPDLDTLKQGTAAPTTQITPAAPKTPEGPVAPPAPTISPPPPPAPGGGMSSISNLRPVASTGGKAEAKVYQVAAGGEMIMTIAERTLGDGNRWSEIYRLNPQVEPRYAIPAGTVLQIPGGR